jgi:phytoene synthase
VEARTPEFIDVSALRSQTSVEEALAHCRQVTRLCARNFYYGLKLSPEPYRSALFTVYAWMRQADDLADVSHGGIDQRLAQLKKFRDDTDDALRGEPREVESLWIALADVAGRFPIDRDLLHAMLDGQIDDLHHRQYQTFEELRDYCYRVASTVGLLCIEIWGYRDPVAREYAIARGLAFQLTNILRDYKQDYDGGRVYLPLQEFDDAGLTVEQLRAWHDAPRCTRFVLQQVERTEAYYERSRGLDEQITPECRPTLWAMTRIYQGLLSQIRRSPSSIVQSRRIRLSAWRKGGIALRAKWLARSTGLTAT